ncbi:MAG: EamA family transporter [Burkholderiales bacterium]|nr:EamA family transporter [Burkholderiales bacterium]MDE2277015.1 EamA family transporter [Burkholderiales bacterium]
MTPSSRDRFDSLLAWFFVIVWGSGYLATKAGLQYAAPFTFLTLRYSFGLLCLLPVVLVTRPRWPATAREWGHVGVAGLLMHAINLSGSHYAQYLGMSAGITALILATQPLFTAVIAHRFLGQRLVPRQWLGVALGLLGVALVVWHKIDVRAVSTGSLVAVCVALASITCGTLYQRVFCPQADLRSASFIQFALSLVVLAPLAVTVEGFVVRWHWTLLAAVAYLVIMASILAVNALHGLMRRGHATRVTSLFFLTPIVAVALEGVFFGVVPNALTLLGIGVTCAGVALVSARS